MSVERRTVDEGGVVPEPPERSERGDPGAKLETKEVWPRRFLERTPTLGWTPNLPDDEVVKLVVKARRATSRPFGSVEAAPEADVPAAG